MGKFRVYDRVELIKGSLGGERGWVRTLLKDGSRAVLSFSKSRSLRGGPSSPERLSSFSTSNLRHLDSNGIRSRTFKDHRGHRRYRSEGTLLTGDVYWIVSTRRRILLRSLKGSK